MLSSGFWTLDGWDLSNLCNTRESPLNFRIPLLYFIIELPIFGPQPLVVWNELLVVQRMLSLVPNNLCGKGLAIAYPAVPHL